MIAQSVLPLAHLPGRLVPDIHIQPLDQAVILKKRNEDARADHAQLRMFPADQGFCAGEDRGLRTHIKLGLVIDFKLTAGDRGREVLNQLLCIELPLMEVIIIDTDIIGKTALDRIRRHLGPVKAAFDIDRLIYI